MISLIHPSRGRAQKAFDNFQNWINKSSGNIEIEHILSIDNDDINNLVYKNLFKDSPITKIISNDNDCVVKAANHAAENSKGDILIYLSDDFDCPEEWDLHITDVFDMASQTLKLNGKEFPCIVRVNDLAGATRTNQPVLTMPIMNRELYEELGYFFFPEYKSMWVDSDLYFITKKYLREEYGLMFPHLHHSEKHCENDDIYRRSEANWNQGAEIFNRRAEQFGWPKRAKIK